MLFKNFKNRIGNVDKNVKAFTPTPTFTIGQGVSLAFISQNIFRCNFLHKRKLVKGFTLIEAMVGIVIIVTAITGPLSVAVSSATYAKDTKDKITAIYLAQEAADVLRFERDSLLIKCSQMDTSICTLNDLHNVDAITYPTIGESFETTSNAAWRMFKSNLSAVQSCFVSTNPNGCTFDFYGFTNNPSSPIKYLSTLPTGVDENCNYLYRDESANAVTGGVYLCKGSSASFTSVNKTKFSRVITLTDVPTIISGASAYQNYYNDDIRVNVKVSYTKSYGLPKTVEVVDFLHAKI